MQFAERNLRGLDPPEQAATHNLKIIFSNFDSTGNPWYGGGGAGAIHEVARRLAVSHSVLVLCGRFPGCQDGSKDGVEYRYIGIAALGPKMGQLCFQALLPLQVCARQFDIWVESLTPPFSTACLPLFTNKPVVALTQILAGVGMAKRYRLPFDWFERLGLKAYRYAIALSPSIQSYISRSSPKALIDLIPNGVSSEDIERVIQKRETHILFLGRIDINHKGLDLLVAAFQQIRQRTSLPLLIAGSGIKSDEEKLLQLLKVKGLDDCAKWVGRVSGDDKVQAFSNAAFMVLPSRYEASPLTVFEAFCYQMPVLMFDLDEFSALPASCCVKVRSFEVPAFAEAIADLANSPEKRRTMGLAAKAYARQFSWDSIALAYEKFLGKVVQTHCGDNTQSKSVSGN